MNKLYTEEKFYVLEMSKDELGHEYEGLYEVCSSEEKAKEIACSLNDNHLLQGKEYCYYTVISSVDW